MPDKIALFEPLLREENEAFNELHRMKDLSHENIISYYGCWTDCPAPESDLSGQLQPPSVSGEDSSGCRVSLASLSLKYQFDHEYHYLCIKMELCEQSLEKWIKDRADRSQVKLSTILNIFYQLAKAVDYIHMKGIYHSDIKLGKI